MTNKIKILEICELPITYEQHNKSPIQILKKIEIGTIIHSIKIEDIRECLERNTDLLNSWLLYSLNKRTSEGWYFKESSERNYTVGYLSKKNNYINELKYSDATEACANYILKEITDIIKSQSK